jgi:hypothetical protein
MKLQFCETQYNCSSDLLYNVPKPSSNYMHHLYYSMKRGILRRSVCVCARARVYFRWCVEQIPGNFLNITKWLVFLMKVGCVLYEVRYEVLFNYNVNERRSRETTERVDGVGLSQILAVPYWLLASSPAFKYARPSNIPARVIAFGHRFCRLFLRIRNNRVERKERRLQR